MNDSDNVASNAPDPQSEAIAALAQVLEDRGDLVGARDTLSSALKEGLNHPGLWHNLGRIQSTL